MAQAELLDEVTFERYGMQKHHPPEDIAPAFVNDFGKIVEEAMRRGEMKAWEKLHHLVAYRASAHEADASEDEGMEKISHEIKAACMRSLQREIESKLTELKK